MTVSVPFATKDGWVFDAVLLSEPDDGGLVLKNVKHANYQIATDIRVVSVWVGSRGMKNGSIQPYYLGSHSLPNTTLIKTNFLPNTKLFAPYPQLLEIATQFQTPGPVIGSDIDDSQQLSITQRYLFTSYGNKPGHEPSENLRAARLYPFVEFSYSGRRGERKPLTYIRIDYRIEISVEMGLALLPPPSYISVLPAARGINPSWNNPVLYYVDKPGSTKGKVQLQQAGVFQDIEEEPGLGGQLRVGGKVFLFGRSAIADVFNAGEKPLRSEMIGWGVRRGNPAEWDNIHVWGFNRGILPSTPGMNHGLHVHWRWGAVAAGKTGPPFYGKGATQFSPTGAGRPMIDPDVTDQNLRFAITGDYERQTNGPWRASDHCTTKNFDDQFISSGKPKDISQGAPLVLWMCMESFRSDDALDRNPKWAGKFFLNGMYFAHDSEITTPGLTGMAPLRLNSPLHKGGPSEGWYVPKPA